LERVGVLSKNFSSESESLFGMVYIPTATGNILAMFI